LLLVTLALSAQACGSADEGTTCEQLTKKLCTMSAACGQSASKNECSFTDGSLTQGRDCGGSCELGLTRDVCGDTTKSESLFSSCLAAIESATCASDGSSDTLALPEACKGLLECKAGPCLD
jgi:hypothetical protein